MTASLKVVGVLGGMGPEATVDFMSKVVAMTPASCDQDHVHMIVEQNPGLPNRQAAILEGGEDPAPAMADMARRLESAGADFLVIPCNTAYAFAGSVAAAVRVPLVSIIDVTVEAVRKRAPEAGVVGVLATRGCLAAGMYQDALAECGIDVVLPTDGELTQLMELNDCIKRGDKGDAVTTAMVALAESLTSRGAQVLIAGCTEIPLVLYGDLVSVPLISSTDELARRTVELAKES